tara:strand:- start:644 stop:994 length:351 start_codon:yes stop_codon:yes gene_type:complete
MNTLKSIIVIALITLSYSCTKEEEPTTVYIQSAVSTPTENEKVRIKNNSGEDTNIGGWTIGDKNNPTAYNIPSNTTISQGEILIFYASTMGFQINDSGETIYLKNSSGQNVDTWYN